MGQIVGWGGKLGVLTSSSQSPIIALGQAHQFIANGTYSDGSIKNITSTAIWSSSNTSVATISASGLATSVAPGTTNIQAVSDGVNSPAQILTVTFPKLVYITITPKDPSITLGQNQQFDATGAYSDGSMKSITASVTWSSGNTSVATIGASGVATSMTSGTSNITATSNGITSPVQILTVTSAKLVSIAVAPINPTISPGQPQQFIANGTYSDRSIKNITSTATWSSSNASVATIDISGLAKSVAAGTTDITAASVGITSPVQVLTITSAKLVSIAITPVNPTIALGQTQQFIANGTYSYGSIT